MPSGTYGTTVSAAGVNIAKSIIVTTDSASGLEVTLPVAWPLSSWVKTDADKAKYVEQYRKVESIELDPTKIERNEALRTLAKLALNSFWVCYIPSSFLFILFG